MSFARLACEVFGLDPGFLRPRTTAELAPAGAASVARRAADGEGARGSHHRAGGAAPRSGADAAAIATRGTAGMIKDVKLVELRHESAS